MQSHVTICPFCFHRSQQPHQATWWFPRPYSYYSWSANWTGHCPTGGHCSQPVFLRSCHIHPALLSVGVKQVPGVLSPSVPTAIPRLRAFSLPVRGPPILSTGSRTDRQAVPGSGTSHTDHIGSGRLTYDSDASVGIHHQGIQEVNPQPLPYQAANHPPPPILSKLWAGRVGKAPG